MTGAGAAADSTLERDCVFCAIAAGLEPASIVYEDGEVLALLSLDQPSPGKVLVTTRAHLETIFDLSDSQAGAVFRAAARVARAVRDTSVCDGLNVVQSNGAAAGQDVQHFHLHLVPRSENDGVVLSWPVRRAERDDLDRMATRIKAKMGAGRDE